MVRLEQANRDPYGTNMELKKFTVNLAQINGGISLLSSEW